jgi:hypothetical protein
MRDIFCSKMALPLIHYFESSCAYSLIPLPFPLLLLKVAGFMHNGYNFAELLAFEGVSVTYSADVAQSSST